MASDFALTHTHTYTPTATGTCQPTKRVLIDWLACKCFAALHPGQDTQSNTMLEGRCRRGARVWASSLRRICLLCFSLTHMKILYLPVIPPTHILERSTLRSFPTLNIMWDDPSFCWPGFFFPTSADSVLVVNGTMAESSGNIRPHQPLFI